jgi:hypothetical protein
MLPPHLRSISSELGLRRKLILNRFHVFVHHDRCNVFKNIYFKSVRVAVIGFESYCGK